MKISDFDNANESCKVILCPMREKMSCKFCILVKMLEVTITPLAPAATPLTTYDIQKQTLENQIDGFFPRRQPGFCLWCGKAFNWAREHFSSPDCIPSNWSTGPKPAPRVQIRSLTVSTWDMYIETT